MLESLSERLQDALDSLRKKGKLSPQDVKEALREVRLALLEADVNFRVVKRFIKQVEERATGEDILDSLTPGQQVIKIVHDELAALMGGSRAHIQQASEPPTVVLMVGLQGSGKTTTTAKLGVHLRSEGRQPLMVAADTRRPAAIDQLKSLGDEVDLPVYSDDPSVPPARIAADARDRALKTGPDFVLVDTAGRMHVDEDLMEEIVSVQDAADPDETLLVVDAMTGQDAVNVAETFQDRLGIDGVVLTKLDGDTRGGAALTVRDVTGRPIKFVGTGERPGALEAFHPDRMASRILGMGDVMTLVERAEKEMDESKARDMERKLREDRFTFDDFLDQLEQVRNMGPLEDVMSMLPGMGRMKQLQDLQVDEEQLNRIEAIIQSMTAEERHHPEIIGGSRRRRIARGSGTSVPEVNRLLKQFKQTRKLMKQFSGQAGKLQKQMEGGGFGPFSPFD